MTKTDPLVLLVDDYDDGREMYAAYLRFSGFRVAEAANGADAIEKCRGAKPDVVLMDVSLPGMDGWEVTRQMKSDPANAGVRIIALTGHVLASHEAASRNAGCDGFLRKPCLPDALLAEIRRVLAM